MIMAEFTYDGLRFAINPQKAIIWERGENLPVIISDGSTRGIFEVKETYEEAVKILNKALNSKHYLVDEDVWP